MISEIFCSERLNLTLELSNSSLSLISSGVISRGTTRTTTATETTVATEATGTTFVETFTLASRSSNVNFNWSTFEGLTCLLKGIFNTTLISELNVSETSALKLIETNNGKHKCL